MPTAAPASERSGMRSRVSPLGRPDFDRYFVRAARLAQIRMWDEPQDRAFEELCSQVARSTPGGVPLLRDIAYCERREDHAWIPQGSWFANVVPSSVKQRARFFGCTGGTTNP